MKQYLLSVYMVEGAPVPAEDEIQRMYADVDAFNTKLQAAGHWVFAGGLHPADVATVVRPSAGGEITTTDGPFAEAKEHIGGFWVIKAADLDEALKLAGEGAIACGGPVEVRPFQDEPESE